MFLAITVASIMCNAFVIQTAKEEEDRINEIPDARGEHHVEDIEIDEFKRRPPGNRPPGIGGGGSGSAYKISNNIYFMVVLLFLLLLKST